MPAVPRLVSDDGGLASLSPPTEPSSFRACFPPALAFLQQRLAHLFEHLKRPLVDLREFEVELFERADDGGTDHYPREPFVVGRHHVPRRHRRRSVPYDLLIHGLISRPQRTLGDIAHRKFPVLRGLIEPVEKPRALRSEEHTSELQSPCNLVCRLLLEKKKKIINRLILTTKKTNTKCSKS